MLFEAGKSSLRYFITGFEMCIPSFRLFIDLFSWLSIKYNIILQLFSQVAVSAFKDFASVEPDLIWLSLNDLFCPVELIPPHKTFKPVRLAGVAPQGKEYAENVNILLSTIWKQWHYYRYGAFLMFWIARLTSRTVGVIELILWESYVYYCFNKLFVVALRWLDLMFLEMSLETAAFWNIWFWQRFLVPPKVGLTHNLFNDAFSLWWLYSAFKNRNLRSRFTSLKNTFTMCSSFSVV